MTPEDSHRRPHLSDLSSSGAGPEVSGALTWRPLNRTDLPALARLVATCEEHDNPPYRTTSTELAADVLDGSGTTPIELENSTLAAFDATGAALAYGRIRFTRTESVVRVVVGGGVHPALRRRGLGGTVLNWQLDRAREIGAAFPGARVQVATYVEEGMGDQALLLREAGFGPTRSYVEMLRDLSEPIPTVPLEATLRLEPWTPDLDEQVRLAHNEAFEDQEQEPETPESWQQGGAHFWPEWSFIVMDRSTDRTRVAGYLLSGRYEQDWEAFGYTVGYTDLLGVRRAWRGRLVGTALLTAAMRAYAASGMQYAGLGAEVEIGGGSESLALYEKLGYRTMRHSQLWSREV